MASTVIFCFHWAGKTRVDRVIIALAPALSLIMQWTVTGAEILMTQQLLIALIPVLHLVLIS